eukprot:CFRG1940T1
MRRRKKEEKKVSKRPANVAFKQQKLRAWQPILTPKSVLPVFFLVGLCFIPLGVVFYLTANSVIQYEVDYTNCLSTNASFSGQTCAEIVLDNQTAAAAAYCHCKETVTINEDIDDQVYIYYAMDNYYQNHRRYVKSRDDNQLHGGSGVQSSCDPLDVLNGSNIAPCGYIANSFFNDTIYLLDSTDTQIPLSANDIAWKSDADEKFKNPDSFAGTVSPPSWVHSVENFPQTAVYPELGQGYVNLDLIVWMRAAAMPNFRKLYRTVVAGGLKAGTYNFDITYNYPVTKFDGRKKMVLSTVSWIGGRNNFLGIAYIVIGTLSLIVGIALLLRHMVAPRQLGDHKYLTWED